MGVAKVILNGNTLIDTTGKTVAADKMLTGYTALDKAGESITGTYSGGGDSWSWVGKNPTKIQEWTEHKKFSDTDFATWTWNTNNTTIYAATDHSPTVSADLSNYSYIQIIKFYVHYDYDNWSPISALVDFSFCGTQITFSWYANASSMLSGVLDYYQAANTLTYQATYHTSTGNLSWTQPVYGLYMSGIANAGKSGSGLSQTITYKRPIIYARGHTSYFSETAFNNLDMDASYYDYKSEIWRVDTNTNYQEEVYKHSIDILNNGI